MKFDFCIGNPPYQEETAKKETKNGQKTSHSIFHYFQIAADNISSISSVLIYPAARWIHRSGKGMRDFGFSQINDTRLKKLVVYKSSKDVFPSTEIGDGISIVIKRQDKESAEFLYVLKDRDAQKEAMLANPGEDLIPMDPNDIAIISKIKNFIIRKKADYLNTNVLPRSLFGIESDFVENNPDKVKPFCKNFDIKNEIKVFTNDKAGKAGRATWFIANKDIVQQNQHLINEWQVVVSSASPGGQKRDNQIEIIDNNSAFGRSRVALKSFKTEQEAKNFFRYANSNIIKYAMLLTDENLTSFAKLVPDIVDYSDKSFIDFSKDIDKQLCDEMGLSDDEHAYIVNKVKSVRA